MASMFNVKLYIPHFTKEVDDKASRLFYCKLVDLLKGVAQEEADLAAVVTLFTFTLVPLGSVELWFDLPNAGYLLLLLTVEIRTGELVSHGLWPKHTYIRAQRVNIM